MKDTPKKTAPLALLLAVATLGLGLGHAPAAEADGWRSFCKKGENKRLCRRAALLCERGSSTGLSCGEIMRIYMTKGVFNSATVKSYRKSKEEEILRERQQ